MEGLEPAAEGDEVGEVWVAEAGEFALDVALGGGEGFFEGIEVLGFGVIEEGGGVFLDLVASAEGFGVA